MTEHVKVEVSAGVMTLTLQRPEKKNALTGAMYDAMSNALKQAETDPSVRVNLFQGDEDKIVPPSQSQMMFDAVRLRGLPTAYLVFHGEQHGFRKSESLKRAQEAELFFFSRIFRFDLPEPVQPIVIENLPADHPCLESP